MKFQVGPYRYQLILADRRIYDEQGSELDGRAIESPRLIVISPTVDPERRREVLRHELQHCWLFSVAKPTTGEEHCQFAAFIDEQFRCDLDTQGGDEALLRLEKTEVPELGRGLVAPTMLRAGTPLERPDTRVCSGCGSNVACGSISNSDPFLHDGTNRTRIERNMLCDCGTLTVWQEIATADGCPTGELVPNPAPRMMHGVEASRWLSLHSRNLQFA